jgi:hypothetical protein
MTGGAGTPRHHGEMPEDLHDDEAETVRASPPSCNPRLTPRPRDAHGDTVIAGHARFYEA